MRSLGLSLPLWWLDLFIEALVLFPNIEREGGYGSPGLGGLRTAGLSPLAGLLDYEDTGMKTSSRVWMGLYLAWKAS